MVWRRLFIVGQTSLATFHQVIQIIYQWDDDHLHQFHIYGQDYGISYEGGIAFSHNASKVLLDDFKFDVGDKFTYQYNFFKNHRVDIRIEAIEDTHRNNAPYCTKGNGIPGVSKYDAIQPTINLLKAFSKFDETRDIGELRSLAEQFNAANFNKLYINRLLKTEVMSELLYWGAPSS